MTSTRFFLNQTSKTNSQKPNLVITKDPFQVKNRFFSTPTPIFTSKYMLTHILSRHETALRHLGDQNILRKCLLVKMITTHELEKALARKQEPSSIRHLIESLPTELPLAERLALLSKQLIQYPARPVITAHPTMVYSEGALQCLHQITQLACQLDEVSITSKKQREIINALEANIHMLIHRSMVPKQCLTPNEEAQRGLFIYQNILKSYFNFLTSVVTTFQEVHGGDIVEIKKQLSPGVKASYIEIGNWIKGDTDGNPNVTAKTMAQTVPDQQKAIIDVYIKHLNDILELLTPAKDVELIEEFQKIKNYFERCLKAIDAKIWFDVAGSEKKSAHLIICLEKILENHKLDTVINHKIQNLCDLLQLVGLAGGLKEFVRQTTVVNGTVFNELMKLLAAFHTDIRDILYTEQSDTYQALSDESKSKLHKLLGSNPDYFETLRQNSHYFSATTKTELERLIFILEHKDIFPYYIYSDTKTLANFDEVRVLVWFSGFLAGKLRIDQMNQHPFFNMPLCETPSDIKNIGFIIRAMLDNPFMREKIKEQGYISYVGGPSDLGKTGGMVTHVELIMAQMQIEDILKEYQSIYPELAHVVVRVLHGFGGDMKRRIGADRQLHCTYQGAAAYYALGAPGAYEHFLHRVVGYPSEADYKVMELRNLKNRHLLAYQALQNFTNHCVAEFEKFANNPATGELLKLLTHFELERKMNTSSRAGSKEVKKSDPSKARAIGVLNHYILAGVHADIYMSLVGISSLNEFDKNMLPQLFSELTVVKDIVYKTIYSIATSDFARAWQRLEAEPQAQQKLGEWQAQAIHVLKSLPLFLPENEAQHAHQYVQRETPQLIKGKLNIRQFSLGLMQNMGSNFSKLADETEKLIPYYNLLADSLEAYNKSPTPLAEENAVLACRGLRYLTEGPNMIADLRSPLHPVACRPSVAPIKQQPVSKL